jgi:predicted enzyme related to lactoylglutathione lyase
LPRFPATVAPANATTRAPISRVIHFEILSKDPAKAVEFYKQALGWKINAWEMPGQTYWLVTTGTKSAAGIDGGMMNAAFPQAVINTIKVKSLTAAQGDIEKAGGKLVQGPYDIPNFGKYAYFSDPEGMLFGVLQPPAASAMAKAASDGAKRSRKAAKRGKKAGKASPRRNTKRGRAKAKRKSKR